MKKIVTFFLSFLGVTLAFAASLPNAINPQTYCPSANSLSIHKLGHYGAYYTFQANKNNNQFVSEHLKAATISGHYVYLAPIALDLALSRSHPNMLICMYDMKNAVGYIIHQPLYGHNFNPNK